MRRSFQTLYRLGTTIMIPDHIEMFWHDFINSESCPSNANDLFQISYQIGSDESDGE